MSNNTKIEWTDRTWNPLRGCSKVSEGCRNCYAIKVAHRFGGEGQPYEGLTQSGPSGPNWTGKIKLVPEILGQPLKWRKPQRVFVNSMSDLFHPEVPEQFIVDLFTIMAEASHHTFQVLTKRPERMKEFLTDPHMANNVWVGTSRGLDDIKPQWPLPNVWIGVSVEDQQAADERIPLLLQTPAAVRFLSMEPLLGPVDLIRSGALGCDCPDTELPDGTIEERCSGKCVFYQNAVDKMRRIDWIIVGGESGPGARPMHPDWARSLRDQCQEAKVAFFFKQWGMWAPEDNFECYIPSSVSYVLYDGSEVWNVGKKAAGRLLDGREWNEFPI